MPTLLHLDSSANLRASRTRALTSTFADAWRAAGPDHLVSRRDLHRDALPHLPDASLHWPQAARPAGSAPPAEAETLQRELLEELLAADVLLVGAPLYNYSVPSTLKAWLDYIHVPGVTAGETQPLAGRPAVVVTSQGGFFVPEGPEGHKDHEVPLLELLLGTALGMAVTVVTVPLALAASLPALADRREQAEADYAAAHETLRALVGTL